MMNKSKEASVWSGIDTFVQQGLRFIVTMVLARLLSPVDYGVIGMLAIFIGLSLAFVESGFPYALIQRKNLSEVDISSVFYFNIGMGLLCAVMLCLAAPMIAAFFNMPVLKPLTWLVAVNLFIGSLGSVQNTLLTKELNFKKICIISVSSTVISGIIALVLAWHHFGVWSLAVQTIVATTITTLLLWTFSSWRPRLVFSIQSILSLFRFGSYMLLSVLVDVLYTRLNTMVIGKWYSASDLGYYTRADQTQQIPGLFISRIIGRVAFPIFSAVHEDKVRLKAGLKKALTFAMMINIPIMLGLVVTAKPLILVLFGEQWGPSVPFLQILCFGGWFVPINVLNMNVLMAQGHSDLFFRLELIKKAIGILLVGVACFFSVTMIAWSVAVTGVLCFFINAYYTGSLLDYGAFRQLRDICPYILGSVVMVGFAWIVTFFPINAPISLVALQISAGFIAYFLFCYMFRLEAFMEMLHMMSDYSKKCFVKNNKSVR